MGTLAVLPSQAGRRAARPPAAQVAEVPDLQARSEYLKIQMDYERSAAKLARGDPSRIGRTPTRTAAVPPAGEGLDLMQLQVRSVGPAPPSA